MEMPTAVIPASIYRMGTQASSSWNNIPTVLILFLLLALLFDYVMYRKKSSRIPPGPTPLPFLGNMLLIDLRNPHISLKRLAEKYGSAYSFQVGWHRFVVLSGFKMIKETLGQKAEDFASRPYNPLFKLAGFTKNCEGILMATYSSGWKEQRKFCVSTLKNFGMGKKTLEERVSEEAGYLCSEFRSQGGSPFDPQNLVNNAVGNIICTLTFGDRFEYNDETFLKLMHLTEEIMKTFTRNLPQIFTAASWLSYVPGPHLKIRKLYNDIIAIVREIVNEHKKTWDPTFRRDFIDAFLEEMEKAKGNPKSSFNEKNLIKIIYDLVAAGTETTGSTILWGLLKMVLHPEVQKKVHEEIDEVLGRHKAPVMEDLPNMPYTNAVIHEIQRCADIVVFAFPYITRHDVEVGKFVIPKGTVVFNHLSSVLKDETMWEKPHQFYPEHFLDANGQFVKREAFLPFSAGRHACPGEPMARMELFIFFTTLLQHFTFCVPKNHPRPKEDRIYALTVSPNPFQICAIPR
ncbi:cytochrome P450 2D14-like [Eublepharis macularius]|uniref:Cytochrome P450 2D14-like n=1 Tax=Eublepharis macularius TaxID=481883 RepID=A0AA97L7F2_EUBMA|nr:cytochrome P450 2D14-like [Eublepharis macularius]